MEVTKIDCALISIDLQLFLIILVYSSWFSFICNYSFWFLFIPVDGWLLTVSFCWRHSCWHFALHSI